MEIWDSYNNQLIKQNTDLVRGQPIPDGLYHIVVEVIVLHIDERNTFAPVILRDVCVSHYSCCPRPEIFLEIKLFSAS